MIARLPRVFFATCELFIVGLVLSIGAGIAISGYNPCCSTRGELWDTGTSLIIFVLLVGTFFIAAACEDDQ